MKTYTRLSDFQYSEKTEVHKFTEFETEQFIFRKFRQDDFDEVYKWHSNEETMGYRRDGVKDEEKTRHYLNWIIAQADADECANFWFAAVRKSDNRLIGEGILIDVPNNTELGWLVAGDCRGEGLGTAIGKALLNYCFTTLNLRRVIAACHTENRASYRIMEKIGMRREAHFIKSKLHKGEWCDRYQYAILREEWEL